MSNNYNIPFVLFLFFLLILLNHNFSHVEFDLHAQCPGVDFSKLSNLADELSPTISKFGFVYFLIYIFNFYLTQFMKTDSQEEKEIFTQHNKQELLEQIV